MVNYQGKQQQIHQNVINNNMINQLTTQQKTQLSAYQQKWQQIAFNPNSISDDNLEKTVKGLYTITGITQPTLVILPHPNAIFQADVIQENLQEKIDKLTNYLTRKIRHQLREEIVTQLTPGKLNKLLDQLIDLLLQDVEVRVGKLLQLNIKTSPLGEIEDRLNNQLHQQLTTNLIQEITKQINFLPLQVKISSNLTISQVILQNLIAKLKENMGDKISQQLGKTFQLKIMNKFKFGFQASLNNKHFKINHNLLNYYQFAALIDFCQTELNCFFPLPEWQAFHFLLNSHVLLHPYQNICYVSTIKFGSVQQPVVTQNLTQHQQKTSLNNSQNSQPTLIQIPSAISLNNFKINNLPVQNLPETSFNDSQNAPLSIMDEFKLYLLDLVKWLLIFIANIIRKIIVELSKLFDSWGILKEIFSGFLGFVFKSWNGIKSPNISQFLYISKQVIRLYFSLIKYIYFKAVSMIIYLLKTLGWALKDGIDILSLLNQQFNPIINQKLYFDKLPYFSITPNRNFIDYHNHNTLLLDRCEQNWRKICLQTNSIDRKKAAKAIKAVYKVRGLKIPKIIFCPNFKFAFKKINKIRYRKNFLGKRLVNNWSNHVLLNLPPDQQRNRLDIQLKITILTELHRIIKNIVHDHFEQKIKPLLGNSPLDYWQYITPEIWMWDAFKLDYYFSVTQNSRNYNEWLAFQEVAKNCGWIIPFENICFVGDRPTKISLDHENRLHGEGEAALEYGDELRLYYYHGVKLPPLYGQTHPNSWEVIWLITERNAELRQALRQGIGYARIAQELPSTTIDTWREYTLLRIRDRIDNEPMFLLKMTCHSTGFTHALRVPPNITSARVAATWANWGVDPESFSIET